MKKLHDLAGQLLATIKVILNVELQVVFRFFLLSKIVRFSSEEGLRRNT